MHYHPVGDTDSEATFCAILNALKAEYTDLPSLSTLHRFLKQICDEIVENQPETTIFNFLLGCGQYTLFAYSWPGQRAGSKVWNGLHYIVREPPFSTAQLVDEDYTIDFAKFNMPTTDRVAVITTKPLTNEVGWTEFKRGQLLMFNYGIPYDSPELCETVEREGRGLSSKCFRKRCSLATAMAAAAAAATAAATKCMHDDDGETKTPESGDEQEGEASVQPTVTLSVQSAILEQPSVQSTTVLLEQTSL